MLVKSITNFVGYYKMRAKTDETIRDDGWLFTGDVAELNPEKGSIRVFDRVSSIIKMSQGEFVSPDKMENTYAESFFVSQMFVYGNSFRDYLVALIHPNEDVVNKFAEEHKIHEESFDALLKRPEIIKAVDDSLRAIDASRKVMALERVKRFAFITEPMSVENGMLTDSMKLKRRVIYAHYKELIDSLF